jgi:diguanylate cyclase (GGDEF)-like protein/PAS domain S-box-containing protein
MRDLFSAATLISAHPVPTAVLDPSLNIVAWNAAATRLLGWTAVEVLGRPCPALQLDSLCNSDRGFMGVEAEAKTRTGERIPVRVSVAPLEADAGWIAAISGEASRKDETAILLAPGERKVLEGRISILGEVDVLTGLATRTAFQQSAAAALSARGARPGGALLLIDLDRFKNVNESFGMDAGDAVLAESARRVSAVLPPGGVASRLGRDEFAAWIEAAEEAEAVVVAREVLEQLAAPFQIGGRSVRLTASVGISLASRESVSIDALLTDAERAMRRAKTEGIGLRIYEPAGDPLAGERLRLESDLRDALDRGELRLDFQPIVRLRDGRRMGAEALIRWTHAKMGPVSPARFIPIAEESGLILALDRWVVTAAVRQLGKWRKAGTDVWVTANISPRSLHDPDFPPRLQALFREFSVDPGRLILEITERVLADPERTLGVFRRLRELGVRIAVDDFGTGYSSLVYLQEFPLDILKVDQMFVRSVGQHEKGEAIARTVIALSHNLGVEALAEGVEEAAQAAWLKREGCDFAQGYHLGVPQKAAELSFPPQ